MVKKRLPRAVREDRSLIIRSITHSIFHKSKFANVEKLCLFIGYPRSGHSLVGALLNAHPDIVISHELDILQFQKNGYSRDSLLSLCIQRDKWFNKKKMGRWGKYDYKLKNGWQGRHRQLRVIGDKKGGRTTKHLQKDPLILTKLQAILKLPIYLIHVVRHPLDNIASISHRRKESVQKTIDNYFKNARFIFEYIHSNRQDKIITLHLEDLVNSPYRTINRLLTFLELEEEPEIYRDLRAIVAPTPLLSRHLTNWSTPLVECITRNSQQIEFLNKYNLP